MKEEYPKGDRDSLRMSDEKVEAAFPDTSQKETVPREEETEDGLSAQISKLQTRIKHMEFNVDQNVKRGEELSANCYNLLRSTELLAFDFVFAEYLLANAPASKVYDFLMECIHPKFNLSSGKQEDFDSAAKYVRDLQSLIQTTAQTLLKSDLKEAEIPRRTSDFVIFIRDQKARLEQEINENEAQAEAVLNEEQSESSATSERIDVNSPEFPSVLSKWIQSEMKFGSAPDEDTIELRCIISSVARRLANVTRLHTSIIELKNKIISADAIEYTDCDPSALINSPFFTGVKSSCSFLITALQTMQAQQELLPRFQSSLETCQRHLATLSVRAQDAVREMQRQLASINEHANQKEEDALQTKEELNSFVDQIYAEPPVTRFSQNEKALKVYSDLEERLNNALAKSNPDQQAKIKVQLNLVQQVRKERDELAQLCDEQSHLVESIHEKNKTLFTLIAENKKIEEEMLLSREETSLLEQFEHSMTEAFNSLHLQEMANWCKQLADVGESFKQCADSQSKIEEELNNFIHTAEKSTSLDDKQKEIEELSEMNFKMAQELGNAQLELESAKEDYFRAQQEVEVFKDWLPDCIDKRNTEQVKKYRAMAQCPLCKTNRRDTILATCGHAMCRACLYRSGNHLCPICKAPYQKKEMRPFFLQ